MNENEHIIAIIAKQLQGVVSEQEAAELQVWLQEDANNQSVYDELATIWQKSAVALANPQFNAEIAWLQLDRKIAANQKRPVIDFHNVISFFGSSKRAAAILALVVTSALAGFWYYNHAQWQTFTASDNNQQVVLADNSVVVLRKGSSLSYPKTFDKKQRLVKLNGEAFFQVQHNDQQPFVINTPHSEVKVVGTSFMVNSQQTRDEVVVVTGKVHVKDIKQADNQVLLTPGQRAILQEDHFYQNEVTDSNFIAWKTGLLNFKNASLQKVLEDVSEYYGIAVEMDESAAHDTAALSINVRFDNQPQEEVLDEIHIITGLSTKKVGEKIIFYRK